MNIYFVLMGVILAIHWSTFFKSIQLSTVAIGLLSFSTSPIFVPFLFVCKPALQTKDIFLLVLLGIVFAAFLLKEIPTLRGILGDIVILSTVFYSTIKSSPWSLR